MAINIERKKVAVEIKSIATETLFQSLSHETDVEADKVETKEKKITNKVLNKYHLPVLNINKPDYWESMPNQDRKHFTGTVAMNTCLGNCCGYENLKAGCCQLDPEDLLNYTAENALYLMKSSTNFDSFISEKVTDLGNFSKSK